MTYETNASFEHHITAALPPKCLSLIKLWLAEIVSDSLLNIGLKLKLCLELLRLSESELKSQNNQFCFYFKK